MNEKSELDSRRYIHKPQLLFLIFLLSSVIGLHGCKTDNEIEANIALENNIPKGKVKLKGMRIIAKANASASGVIKDEYDCPIITCSVTVRATVTIDGKKEKIEKVVTSTASAKGTPVGESYELKCEAGDPLLLEVPKDVSNIFVQAIGNTIIDLIVDEYFIHVKIGPDTYIEAGPNTKIIAISFPDDMPDGIYDIDVDFQLDSVRPIEIKGILSAKATIGDETFLAPILPAIVSFEDAISITLPISNSLIEIFPNVENIKGAKTTLFFGVTDLNEDGVVDMIDLQIVEASYGAEIGDSDYDPLADLNDDGIVNLWDLMAVGQSFGREVGITVLPVP